MKKNIFLLFILLLSLQAFNQKDIFRAVKLYYRVNPFDRKFSAMLMDILSDTSFVKKDMKKRTDSSFFFLSGHYKHFNPFAFAATPTEIRIAETEIPYSDSLHTYDTVFIYQVLGITENTEAGKAAVQKELSRFHRKYNSEFWGTEYKEAESNGVIIAGIYNYYFFGRQVPPLSSAWGKLPGEQGFTFTITLRLKVKENFAFLPIAPDEF